MTPVAEIAQYARTLLSDRGRWTRGVAARNKYGFAVAYSDSTAVSFSLVGAIWRAAHDLGYTETEARRTVRACRGYAGNFLSRYENHYGFEDVHSILDRVYRDG